MISKKKTVLQTNKISQIALLCHDIEKTSKAYAALLGVKPPKIRETASAEKTQIKYRGKPTQGRAKLAFFRFRNITLELIEPTKEPSTWREYLDEHGEGLHHIAFNIRKSNKPAIVTQLEKQGAEVVQEGKFIGGSYTYVDAKESLKLVLELLD